MNMDSKALCPLLALLCLFLLPDTMSAPLSEGGFNHYSVQTPTDVLRYSVPKGFVMGHGGHRSVVRFDLDEQKTRAGRVAPITTFYRGVQGNFADWDVTIEFALWAVEEDDLESYKRLLSGVYATPLIAKDGRRIRSMGDPTIREMDGIRFIYAQTADMTRKIVIDHGKSQTHISPSTFYYVLVAPKLFLRIDVTYENKRTFNARYNAEMDEIVRGIIKQLEVIQKAAGIDVPPPKSTR